MLDFFFCKVAEHERNGAAVGVLAKDVVKWPTGVVHAPVSDGRHAVTTSEACPAAGARLCAELCA